MGKYATEYANFTWQHGMNQGCNTLFYKANTGSMVLTHSSDTNKIVADLAVKTSPGKELDVENVSTACADAGENDTDQQHQPQSIVQLHDQGNDSSTNNTVSVPIQTAPIIKVFQELEEKVQVQLKNERDRLSNLEQTKADDGTTNGISSKFQQQKYRISIHDPNFDINMIQTSEPTFVDILESWEQLIQVLQQENVFTQYIGNLERAFRAVQTTTSLYGKTIRTLLELLIQAALHHSYDMSIECRFVTLLEVILSYDNPRWEPTDAVITVWKRLLQRIPANIAPSNFRRKAYRVLVSLSWVPSSKGLLAACSFDETKQLPTFRKEQICAHISKITEHNDCINNKNNDICNNHTMPLPRHDSVNQLLDRLKDETDVCVAITSCKEGMGKTTLAGQVASHPSIIRVFTVLWLDIQQQKLTFDSYINYLKDLCKQLEISEPPEWPVSLQRFEEPAIRQLRELGSMKIAKAFMIELIEQHGKNLLLVLDDVLDAQTIQWFHFTGQQSIIVTTPHSNLDGVDWTLDLLPMSQEEAVELFLNEAALPPEHILGRTIELRTIVQQCKCHPLTIRTIARWFLLKQVTNGKINALTEILDDLKSLTETHALQIYENCDVEGPNELMFDILSMMMGPIRKNEADTQSVLFVLCFAAMVVVFPDVAPLDSVILLWEQILKKEVLATDEIGGTLSWKELSRYIWLIAEGLTHMGVISIVDADGWYKVQVHHHIYEEFGMLIAKEMEVKETFHHTTVDWHKFFVTGYMSKKSQGVKDNNGGTWKYIVEKLPSHMLQAHMLSTTNVVLSQEDFFQARIETLGWSRGIEIQIKDCVQVQHRIENGDETEVQASHVFNTTSVLIKEAKVGLLNMSEQDRCEAVAKALYLLGFALTENGYFRDALIYLEMAGSIPHESQTLRTKVTYATCWCFLSDNQTAHAKRKIECIQMSTSQDKVWLNKEIFQLKAAVLLGACNYRAAKILLEDFLHALEDDEESNCIELATTLEKLGRLYFLMGENELAKNALMNCIDRKHEIGEISRSLSSTLSILGDVNVVLGLFNDARESYDAAIKALKTLRCNEQHLDYRFITGKLQLIADDFAGCSASFELVRRTSNATPLKLYDQSAYDLRYIAQVYYEMDDIDESISILLESLVLTQSRPLSLERAKCMIVLGKCYLKNGMDEKALSYFKQAREIQMSKLGIYGDVIDSTNLIGELHMKLGAYSDALIVLKKNYDEVLKSIPEDTDRVHATLYSVADAYEVSGDIPEAIKYFKVYKAGMCIRYGQGHRDYARALQRLGKLAVTCKDYDEAMISFSEALAIRREHFDQAGIVETLTSFCMLARSQNNYDLAVTYLLEAYSITTDEQNVRVHCKIALELGYTYRLLPNFDKAFEVYKKFFDKIEKGDKGYGLALMALGHIKFAQGDYMNASCDYKLALQHLSEILGPGDYNTVKAQRSVGLASFFGGNFDDAIEYFHAFLRFEATVRKSSPVDLIIVQIFNGDLSYARKEFDEATTSWNCAKTILLETVGDATGTTAWLASAVDDRLNDDGNGPMIQNKFEEEIKGYYILEQLS